jgi:DNA polymerase-3 subunit gamma/tau
MPYEITATRKRPRSFDDLAGQDFVSTTLRASIASGRIAHAYLFSGPRGCGKTSTARILARSLNCEKGPSATPCGVCESCKAITRGGSLDVIEIDGASNTSVDNIRQIKDEVLFPPNFSKYKIYIIDEVHMLSNSAFNALLKTIEEPPPYIIFIFATTELHKVPATIKSRCQQYSFRLIPLEILRERLRSAAADLGVEADDEALLWIATEATGSLRDAYTLFDQVAAFSDGRITADGIREKLGLVGSERMGALLSLCVSENRKDALELMDSILESGVSVEQFVSDVVSYCRSLLMIAGGVEKESLLGAARSAFPDALVQILEAPMLERMLATLFDLYRDMRYSINPRWEVELVVSRLCSIRDYIPPAALARTVRTLKAAMIGGKAPGAAQLGAMLNPEDNVVRAASEPVASTTPVPAPRSGQTNESEPVKQVQRMESSLEVDGEIDLVALKASLLTAMGKNRVVLSACIERSGAWFMDGDKLVMPCANGYDAGAMLAEAPLLAKKALDICGRAFRVEPRAAEPVPQQAAGTEGGDDEDSDDGDDGPADPVAIVERVFRGRRVDTGRPAAVHPSPAGINEEEN